MRTQYKQILEAHTTFVALANSAVEAVESELGHAAKREKHLRNELAESQGRSPRAADEAAITEYEKQLKGVHEDLLATQASEKAALEKVGELENLVAEHRSIIKNYEDELNAARETHLDREELDIQLAGLTETLDKEHKAAKSLQSENNKLYADLDKVRKELGILKQDAKKKDQQFSKTIMELQDLKKLKADLAAQLDAAKLEAEEHRTALEEYKNLPQAGSDTKLHEDMHRAGELVQKALEEDDPEKQFKYLDRALAKLGRPEPEGATA